MGAMESPSDESSKVFERTEPLSESEVDELAIALRKLAEEGIALPKHLIATRTRVKSSLPA